MKYENYSEAKRIVAKIGGIEDSLTEIADTKYIVLSAPHGRDYEIGLASGINETLINEAQKFHSKVIEILTQEIETLKYELGKL